MEGSVLNFVLQVKTYCLERASYSRLQSLHRSGSLDGLTEEPGFQSPSVPLEHRILRGEVRKAKS